MKKISIALALLVSSFFIFGQSIQLSFTGLDATTNNHIQVDSILIKNLSKTCDTTLFGTDSILVLFPTGIDDLFFEPQSFNLIQNYPNPFQDITNFGLQVSNKERIVIQLFTLVGQKVAEYDRIFDPGIHLFSCEGTPGNFYLLTASNGTAFSSLKMLSTSDSKAYGPRINHIAHTNDQAVYKKVNTDQEFTFSYGDQLEFTGYSSGYIPVVILSIPQTDTDYIFSFEGPFSFTCGDPVADERDGSIYQTVEIGSQCWITTNLNIGMMIGGGLDQQDNSEIEKYCYENIEANCDLYGGLYQWDEMMEFDTVRANQGICPNGWHLPSIVEWDTLINYLGGASIAGEALKQGGASGFEALLGGRRENNGTFSNMGSFGYFSSTSQLDDQTAWYRYLLNGDPGFYEESLEKVNGYSVRCIKGYPSRINPLVVVIDTNTYLLLSDSLELAQGIYRYLELQQPLDSIGLENIIIGITDEGYLREVTGITQTGDELTLITEVAALDDIWDSGEFSLNFNLANDTSKTRNEYSVIDFLAEGTTIKDSKDGGVKFELENVTLYENGPVKISIPSGYFKLDPNFKIDGAFSLLNGVEFFYVGATNATFEADAKLQLALTENLTINIFEEEIASFSKYYLTPTFPPLVIVAAIELKVKDEMSAGITFTTTTGYTQSKVLDFGIVYQNNNWGQLWNYQSVTDSVHSLEYNVIANFANKLSLVPEISIKLFGKVGPYFNIPLYKKFDTKMSLFSPNCWDMEINLGMTALQAFDGKAISEDLSFKVWDLGPYELPIWNFPDSVIYIKGNNQTGDPDETLPDSLIIKVVDNFGEGWPMVPAEYLVINGDGSVSDTVAITSDNGFARTIWTLGPDGGQNTVNASVRKSDLNHVKESPFEFNATAIAPDPCPGIPTVTYEGQTYNTVLIGDQCWFKENLNVGTMIIGGTQIMTNNDTIEKLCYYNNPDNCEIFGGLYEWNEVMQYTTEEGVQGICPEGWHIPTDDEWKILEGTVDSQFPVGSQVWDISGWRGFDAGHHLKSTTLWDNGNGNDTYGFKALPAGTLPINPIWTGLNDAGDFWTSSMVGTWYARARALSGSDDGVSRLYRSKGYGFSLRCLKD